MTICNLLSPDLQCTASLSSEKGASSWLSALPVEEQGVLLSTREPFEMLFACAMGGSHRGCLYSVFVVRVSLLIIIILNCPTRGYPTLRHNELCDFTDEVLSEVCADVSIEPTLQPLSGEIMTCATAGAISLIPR